MTIANIEFLPAMGHDVLRNATEAANAWLDENLASVISIETIYLEGYFAKPGGIRVWYRESE
jgi:hypothetical protein